MAITPAPARPAVARSRRRRSWQAAFLVASVCSFIALEATLAAVPANTPAHETAGGSRAIGEGSPSKKVGGVEKLRQENGGVDQYGADRGVSERDLRGGKEKVVPPATVAAAAGALLEERRGIIRPAGALARPENSDRKFRRKRETEMAGSGSDYRNGGSPLPGGANNGVLLRASRGESRGRKRRAQQSDGGEAEEGSEEAQEGEEDTATAEEEGLYGEEEDGVGSVGLLALVVCFGLLFCVMEVAKCYFLLECRRRQRWRRWRQRRAQENSPPMPIASSRVVATDVPVAGSKDGWVEIVIDGVAMRNSLPGDKDMPSAPGYAVAGASHALQDAIEHARRLSPHRSYSATFFPPRSATPEEAEIIPPETISPEIPTPEMAPTEASSETMPAHLDTTRAASGAPIVAASSPARA